MTVVRRMLIAAAALAFVAALAQGLPGRMPAVLAGGALAQSEVGDAEAGRQVATAACADCHSIGADDGFSPHPAAPEFDRIANTPGMTAMALFSWMTSSHPSMPNVMLQREQLQDVVAYILSLDRQ